jgi:hypothetical protein
MYKINKSKLDKLLTNYEFLYNKNVYNNEIIKDINSRSNFINNKLVKYIHNKKIINNLIDFIYYN